MHNTIVSRMRDAASRNPTAPAFIYQNQQITYGQFDAYVCSAARIFHEQGIREGDIVTLTMMQSPVYCIAMFALASIGAVSVPLNPATSPEARRSIRDRYGVKACVSDLDDPGLDGVPLIKLVNLKIDKLGANLDFTSFRPAPQTTFCIAMSSGTTGDSKGIAYTHQYLLDMVEQAQFELAPDTRLVPLAMHIAFGFVFAIGVLTIGGTLVFTVGQLQELGAFINLYAVTHMAMPPAIISKLLPYVPDGGNPFPSLRRLRVGGAGMSAKLVDSLCRKFPNNIEVVYGLTELGAVSIARPDVLTSSPMSCGRVIPRFKLEIIDENDHVVPAGTPGEIRIRLKGMPDGYYKDDQNSRSRFRNGWYCTGDAGRLSVEGLLSVEGRMDDIISIDGHKVSPAYVEEILTRHPRINDAVVFGTKGKDGDEILAAAVILAEGNADQELVEYGRTHLGLASPKKYFAMHDFPRNSSGKVLRQKIASVAQESNLATS